MERLERVTQRPQITQPRPLPPLTAVTTPPLPLIRTKVHERAPARRHAPKIAHPLPIMGVRRWRPISRRGQLKDTRFCRRVAAKRVAVAGVEAGARVVLTPVTARHMPAARAPQPQTPLHRPRPALGPTALVTTPRQQPPPCQVPIVGPRVRPLIAQLKRRRPPRITVRAVDGSRRRQRVPPFTPRPLVVSPILGSTRPHRPLLPPPVRQRPLVMLRKGRRP